MESHPWALQRIDSNEKTPGGCLGWGLKDTMAGVEAALPFPILGFDTDNSREFLNWHLVDYCPKRPVPAGFIRSCPDRKNNNARVE